MILPFIVRNISMYCVSYLIDSGISFSDCVLFDGEGIAHELNSVYQALMDITMSVPTTPEQFVYPTRTMMVSVSPPVA